VKLPIAAAVLVLAACAAPPAGPEPQQPAAELAGYAPGAPVNCVSTEQLQGLRLSDTNRHVLLYGTGAKIWANPVGSCGYGRDDVLVTEPFGSQICRGDIVRSFDRLSRIPGPACVLGDFIPYTRS
jgi:hypothetical protein